jgi:hypothetical protein
VRARSLGTAAQKKKKKNDYWYLQDLLSVPLSFGWLQENTRLCHGRRRV